MDLSRDGEVSNQAFQNLKLASKECGSAHSLLAENQPGHFILIRLEMPWTLSLKKDTKNSDTDGAWCVILKTQLLATLGSLQKILRASSATALPLAFSNFETEARIFLS